VFGLGLGTWRRTNRSLCKTGTQDMNKVSLIVKVNGKLEIIVSQ
jgi:hypothetical protein